MAKVSVPKSMRGRKTVSHNYAPKQESSLADELGGEVVKGSGCGAEKGDIRITGVARIECKSTIKKSFSITRKMVEKIEDTAMMSGETPFVQLDFLGEKGGVDHSLVIMPRYVLESVLGELKE